MLKESDRVAFRLFLTLVLFLSGLGCGFDLSRLFPEQMWDRPPPAVKHRMISQDIAGRLVWHRSSIFIRGGLEPSPGLLAGHGYVAFVNFIGGPLSMINQLDLLDANTGDILWQSEPFPDHEAVAISEDRAFILLNEGSPLNIYNMKDDNEPLVQFDHFKEAAKFYMFPTVAEEGICIYYQQGNEYSLHRINLEGNEVASPRRIQVIGFPSRLFMFDEPYVLKTGEEYIWANFETGDELWRIPAPGRIDSWPVLKDGTLIISAGDGVRYLLIAVDAQTGHKLWETEKVFGPSVVLHQDSLYALRNDAVLTKLDFTRGQIQEEIPFEPNSIDAGKWAYLLASDGERLFVYFGDSQELFTLKIP